MTGTPEGRTRVAGIIEYALLPNGRTTIIFTRGNTVVRKQAKDNRVRADLLPGTYAVRSPDGRICAPHFRVNPGGGWQLLQLAGFTGC